MNTTAQISWQSVDVEPLRQALRGFGQTLLPQHRLQAVWGKQDMSGPSLMIK